MPYTIKIEVNCFDRCFSDYVTDWSGLVVGVEGAGQDRERMIQDVIDAVVDEASDEEYFPFGDHAFALLRDALREVIQAGARFWPHDANGNDVNTDELPEADLPDEQSSYWFRILVTRSPMLVRLSTSDDDNGTVTVYCDDVEGARSDQSIDGSNWECPGDLDVAYASVMDRPSLVEDLEKEGYEVDCSEYSSPDAEDMARWQAKYLAEGGE